MDNDKKEPQSYGSGEEWVTGDTGQTVNRLKGAPNAQNADFYASRHDQSNDQQPGTAPAETAAPAQPEGPASGAHDPVQNVTDQEGGAKRHSFFKDRDYD